MSSASDDAFKLPRPFLLKDADVSTDKFVPVDTFSETKKIAIYSSIFLGGMHVRRLLQHRMGSARPGQERYLKLFELAPRHFISIPFALATYSFLSSSLYNLDEKRTTKNEVLAASSAVLVATIFKKIPLNQKVGLALSMGVFVGLFNWTGGLVGNMKTNFTAMTHKGEIHNQESNKSLDEDFANGTYKKQGFWELLYRKPLSETIEDLGEGRGIGKI